MEGKKKKIEEELEKTIDEIEQSKSIAIDSEQTHDLSPNFNYHGDKMIVLLNLPGDEGEDRVLYVPGITYDIFAQKRSLLWFGAATYKWRFVWKGEHSYGFDLYEIQTPDRREDGVPLCLTYFDRIFNLLDSWHMEKCGEYPSGQRIIVADSFNSPGKVYFMFDTGEPFTFLKCKGDCAYDAEEIAAQQVPIGGTSPTYFKIEDYKGRFQE